QFCSSGMALTNERSVYTIENSRKTHEAEAIPTPKNITNCVMYIGCLE
ncbi:unnamed protein product, partial [marine sediment metagenome]